MFIEHQYIQLSNFLSYGKAPTRIELNKYPSVLFVGQNGAGKSGVQDALSFVLWDDIPRGVKKGQLVNATNQKNCVVEHGFRIGKDSYVIKRSIKPNDLQIMMNGSLIPRDSKVPDLQKYLEQVILRSDRKSYNQIVSLAEGNFTPFMHLEAKDRRIFVDKVFGVGIYTAMNTMLGVESRALDTHIADLGKEVRNIDEKIKIHESYIEKNKTENKQKLEETHSEISELKSKKEAVDEDIKTEKEELETLKQGLPDRKEVQTKLNEVRDKISKVQVRIATEEKKLRLIEENSMCPTCEREFSQEYISKERQRIELQLKEYSDTLEKGKVLKTKFENRIIEIETQSKEIESASAKLKSKEFTSKQYQSNIERLEKQIDKLEEASNEGDEDVLKEMTTLRAEKDEVSEEEAKSIRLRELYRIAAPLLKDDGIKAEIVRKYIPMINAYTNKFLEAMGYDLSFYLNKDFDEEIRTRGKESYTYNSFSRGQRQRIDLALLFTWRQVAKMRNSISSNILMLDEILDSHLSEESTEAVLDMLQSDLFKDTNIFVVSQKRDLSAKFAKTYRFDLVDDFTQVS